MAGAKPRFRNEAAASAADWECERRPPAGVGARHGRPVPCAVSGAAHSTHSRFRLSQRAPAIPFIGTSAAHAKLRAAAFLAGTGCHRRRPLYPHSDFRFWRGSNGRPVRGSFSPPVAAGILWTGSAARVAARSPAQGGGPRVGTYARTHSLSRLPLCYGSVACGGVDRPETGLAMSLVRAAGARQHRVTSLKNIGKSSTHRNQEGHYADR